MSKNICDIIITVNNNPKKIILAIFGAFFVFYFIFSNFSFAEDLTTASFILRDSAITVLGGRADSTSFQNISAAGQLVIGDSTSASYIDQNGILYFDTATSSGGGGGGGGGGGSSFGAGPAPSPAPGSVGIIKKIIQKIFGCNLISDLNQDCQVNIRDVSILLYGWGQSQKNPNFLASIKIAALPSPDLNNDFKVNIKDLSMMLFNWTG